MPTLIPWLCALAAWADPPGHAPASPPAAVLALESALTEAIERAEPSVVAIAREKSDGGKTTAVRGRNPEPSTNDPRAIPAGKPGGAGADWVSFDYGSGVVIGKKGEILTAFHVVRAARRLVVRAVDRQVFEAEVIAADPRSDLAVIVPRDLPDIAPPKLQPMALGDATKLRKGSFLLALGNPFNAAAHDGRASASWGILSNISRRLADDPEDPNRNTLRYYPTLLQLDAKLNLGMGGGAVINLRGELVGVTTAAASVNGFDAQAGYAIPLDAIGRRAVETLREGKEVEYGFLGINLDEQGTSRVASARPGTPAAEGGIQTDDVVVAVNGKPVTDRDSLLLAINALSAGASVKIKVDRQSELLEKTVELAKYPILPPSEVIATNVPAAWRGLRVDYTSRHPNIAGQFGDPILNAMSLGGVVVVEVEPDSPAEKAGLKKGQVITQIGTQRVRNPREFARIAAEIKDAVMLRTDLGEVTVP
ncbi:MAG: PDZ domain-containing protein [Isosphaeraceae bacterium]|nr:PDZ domain-containing protein [Isosphaeraceae bacterium]